MIDHLFGHAAVDTDVLASDESRLVGGKEENHVRNVERIADTTCEVLRSVRPGTSFERGVNPFWRDGVDSDTLYR